MANEEMAEGGQVGGSKGVGLGKGGGGWLALLICKTANLRTLCLPALSSSFSTFSTTAFSSYGRPLLALSRFYPLSPLPPPLSLSLARLISAQSLLLSHARFSALANTHTNPHCHSLALAILFRLTCLRSLIPVVRPVSSTYLL